MKIEAGKYYKLRNGDLAYVEAVFKPMRYFPMPELPVIGRSIYHDRLSWDLNGAYGKDKQTALDIVAPFTGVIDKEAQRLAIQKRMGVKLCGHISQL